MICLDQVSLKKIKWHAELDYPHECCGLLIGCFETDGRKIVSEVYRIENAREAEKRYNRSLILPNDLVRAEGYARSKGLEVVGNYHSHPDASAVPSQYDLEHALPVWSYVIISVRKASAAEIDSWELKSDRSIFGKEFFEITAKVEMEK